MTEEAKTCEFVDAAGNPAVDPTKNVIALTESANKRQDDLRELNDRRVDAEIRVLAAHIECLKDTSALRAAYEEKLTNAEAKRIDAIRSVDVNAVAVASQKQSDQATVLANQVVASAEALRGLVATTAQAQSAASQQAMSAFADRISTIEKAQYEEKGKQGVVDPLQAAMYEEMKILRTAMTAGAGQTQGAKNMWGYIVGAIGLLGMILVLLDRISK